MATKPSRDHKTPLRNQVETGGDGRRTRPIDALSFARQRFLKFSHVDMQALAADLDVNRVTLYRWVGNQELLLGEVLWSLAADAWTHACATSGGHGAEKVADAIYEFLCTIRGFEPVQRFLKADSDYALRVLTSRHSVLQERVIGAFRDLLHEQSTLGYLRLPDDLESLAYALVRLGEGFLYNDLITGREPDLDKARMLVRALLRAPWDSLK